MRRASFDLTKKQIVFIKKNWNKISNGKMAKLLNINFSTLSSKLHRLGLYRMHFEYWTEEQVKFLKKHYKKIGDKEMAILFNSLWEKEKRWSFKHIEKKRRYLNLKRSQKEINAIKIRNRERGCWLNTGTWKTRGEALPGEVRIWTWNRKWSAKVVKTEDGFVLYARWLYKKRFGDIPDGYIIGFKDRDNMNVVPENLELITRAQHAFRNRWKYPDELYSLQGVLKELNNTINQKRNEYKKRVKQ